MVIPASTSLTDLPRSAKLPMKNPNPERPLEVFNCGIANEGPDSEPVGISSENVEGRGLISAATLSGKWSLVGAFPTLIIIGFEPTTVAEALPLPAEPVAPSSRGGVQPKCLRPEILEERVEEFEEGSWWNRKWSPDIVSGEGESPNWSSISSMEDSEDHENEFPEVVVNEEGSPLILAA